VKESLIRQHRPGKGPGPHKHFTAYVHTMTEFSRLPYKSIISAQMFQESAQRRRDALLHACIISAKCMQCIAARILKTQRQSTCLYQLERTATCNANETKHLAAVGPGFMCASHMPMTHDAPLACQCKWLRITHTMMLSLQCCKRVTVCNEMPPPGPQSDSQPWSRSLQRQFAPRPQSAPKNKMSHGRSKMGTPGQS
jgi:hypothetical protein